MPDSEGKKELEGIARSIDVLFSGRPESPPGAKAAAPSPPTPEEGQPPSRAELPGPEVDEDAGLEPPPAPPNVRGDALAGAPLLPDMPEPDGPPPLPDDEPTRVEDEPTPVDDEPTPVEDEPTPMEEDAAGAGVRPDLEAATGSASPPEEEADFEPTRLDLAVDAYVAGDVGKADEIRTIAGQMLESRELDPVARSVGRLAAVAGEPPDEEIRALADSISSPVVLARLAVQMGSERDEQRRREYYRACRALGEPMAVAIRNDLAESTDRLARRIHCEALVEMGPAGRKMIEEMALDDNRFLVRNAVAILGDTGGERAVELVTSALANPDARVRREALRSLAKLGDEESGDVVVGLRLLEDPDEEVRIGAAVAAGELRVERALRPLISMLDEAKDPDVAIPAIRALGHLGDPGAVPSLEKHAVRTLFSKPRTDVRIAAYRALHQIGTPHASQLVDEAVDDKEPEVKAAVREMLGMR